MRNISDISTSTPQPPRQELVLDSSSHAKLSQEKRGCSVPSHGQDPAGTPGVTPLPKGSPYLAFHSFKVYPKIPKSLPIPCFSSSMVSTSVLAPLPLHPAFMVQLTVRTQEEWGWDGGGEQASEVSRVDSEELRWPPSLHGGRGRKAGRKERDQMGPSHYPSLMPIPDSGGFLSPTWTMVELKLH